MRRLSLLPARFGFVAFLLGALVSPFTWAGGVKTDLDADLSRDGVISNDDPRDNGEVQEKPPGLPIVVGRLERIVLRCEPKTLDKGYVRLTVVSNPGEWSRLKDPRWLARPRRPVGGHIRVWKDAAKTTLVLDSQDPTKMTMIWRLSYETPLVLVPPNLFVEGMVPSRESGDVVLVLEYGPTVATTGADSTRDILVMTVSDPPLAVALDGDVNHDGTIDSQDTGEAEDNPPGLPITIGAPPEKVLLRCEPQNQATGWVRLTIVSGPYEWKNRQDVSVPVGPRRPAGGFIRVWEDAEQTKLLLDTEAKQPAQTTTTWVLSEALPMGKIPAALYVEGVSASREDGDVILVVDYGTTDAASLRDILVMTVRETIPEVALDGDVNHDGTIDNQDTGEVEDNPPGLAVPVGALQKLSLHCVPKSPTEGYVRFTVLSGAGEWQDLQDPTRLPRPRRPAGGRVRIWQDADRTTLILDSHVQEQMMVVWTLSNEFPIDRVPTTVYTEGLEPSQQDGDVSLVLGYGLVAAADQPELLQDILVVTVRSAAIAIDLVGDVNRDGTINPDDPADNGVAEDEPPGLPVGIGQLQKLMLRCVPKSMTEGYVRFTVLSGRNEWKNLQDPTRLPRPRRPGGGRIRVWQDADRTILLLDSHVQGKMMVVWTLSEDFPFDLVPTTVYVEGLAASKEGGDVSLVLGYGLVGGADQPELQQDVMAMTVGQ